MQTATVFAGRPAVDLFAAMTLKTAIERYAKTGMKMSRMHTPKNMLAKAMELTGQTFKRGQYQQAIDALSNLIESQKQKATVTTSAGGSTVVSL